MRLIAAVAIAAALAAISCLAMPPTRTSRMLERVRVARGVSSSAIRDRVRRMPLLRSWRPVGDDVLRLAGFADVAPADLAALKIAAALVAGLVAAVSGAVALVALAAYAAFVAPSLWVERLASARLAARRDAVLPLVDRVIAMSRAGATVEQALASVAVHAGGLAPLLREATARAALGVSVFDACAEVADRERVDELRELAAELGRARRGGQALLPVLAERRDALRTAHRAARLDAASRVDGALSLVLVLAYLPALLALVVVPLFLGLIAALGE